MDDKTIQTLLEAGKISKKDVKEVFGIDLDLTEDFQQAVDLLHTVLCDRTHEGTFPTCRYLDENQIAECWKDPDHKRWMRRAVDIKEIANLTDNELLAIVIMSTETLKSVQRTADTYGRPYIELLYMIISKEIQEFQAQRQTAASTQQSTDDQE